MKERGLARTLLLGPVLPVHVLRELWIARMLAKRSARSEFDIRYGVDTDGDVGGGDTTLRGRTFLSDLEIPSPNWIYGKDYSPILPERFFGILSRLDLNWKDLMFVDFGSGKGRALLLASELPFRKIVGIEFAPKLHKIAESNILKYFSPTQACKSIESICMDLADFNLPAEPCVVYFLDPCRETIHLKMLENIRKSWKENPRRIVLIYVSPLHEKVFDSAEFLAKLASDSELWFSAYEVVGY